MLRLVLKNRPPVCHRVGHRVGHGLGHVLSTPISTSIPTNKLYRGRLPGIYTEFVIYIRFIPESVFYTQFVMLSPLSIPESMFYTQSAVHSPQSFFYTDRYTPLTHFMWRTNANLKADQKQFIRPNVPSARPIISVSHRQKLNHATNRTQTSY